nr:hypothetical protein [Leptospira interrogans]
MSIYQCCDKESINLTWYTLIRKRLKHRETQHNALLNSASRFYHNQPHKYLDLNIKSVGITTNPL